MNNRNIDMSDPEVAEFCQRHHVRRLLLFGSVLRSDFGPDSDVDILVEFESDSIPGMIRLAGMEIELSGIIGRQVDLMTPGFLREDLRKHVQDSAEVAYAED